MIPFDHTWPYERQGKDFYVQQCPFCDAEHVHLALKQSEVKNIQTGMKKLLIFPCCYGKIKIIDMDDDYLLADEKLRQL